MKVLMKTFDLKKIRNVDRKVLICMAWLLAAMAVSLIVLAANYSNLINSDDAAEMILAQLLSDGNGVISRGWIYSSEIRILNTQLFRSLVFRITENWLAVRIAANVLMYVWLLLSYAFFMKQYVEDFRWFWYTAPLLFTPLSWYCYYVIGLMAYYIPHISIAFLILGLWGRLYHGKSRKKAAWICLLFFSFMSGLGGTRLIFNTFIPMLTAMAVLYLVYSKEGDSLIGALKKFPYLWISTAVSFLGYAVNTKVLSQYYFFESFSSLHLRLPTFDSLQLVLRALINAFGYSEDYVPGTLIFSITGIYFILVLLFILVFIVVLIFIYKKRQYLRKESMFLFTFASLGLFETVMLLIFSDMGISPRFFIVNLVMFIPLAAVIGSEIPMTTCVKKSVMTAGAALVIILGIGVFGFALDENQNSDKEECIAWLEENGYTFGYASFWNADVITELTSGNIEMVSLQVEDDGSVSQMVWLVKLDNLFPENIDGPVFLLLNKNELSDYAPLVEGREAAYSDETYRIFIFDDSYELSDLLVWY